MALPLGLAAVVIGVVATLIMDVASAIGLRLGTYRLLPLGRWAAYLLRGTFRHADIAKAAPVRGEGLLTVPVHYGIGIGLALVYLAVLELFSLGPPSFGTAAIFGLATTVLPAFLMFPSMGYGLLGLAGQPKYFLLRQSLVNHLAFGVGLWLGSLLL
jgi:hypothetical protein